VLERWELWPWRELQRLGLVSSLAALDVESDRNPELELSVPSTINFEQRSVYQSGQDRTKDEGSRAPSSPLSYLSSSILSLLPNSLFILLSIFRILHLRRKPFRLAHRFDALLCSKSLFGLLLLASSCASLGLSRGVQGMPKTTVPAGVMGVVSAVSAFERDRRDEVES
jgi:hypothetical protein